MDGMRYYRILATFQRLLNAKLINASEYAKAVSILNKRYDK